MCVLDENPYPHFNALQSARLIGRMYVEIPTLKFKMLTIIMIAGVQIQAFMKPLIFHIIH